jgi:aminoglycoside phosphotransferase (APT) family kinase protein
MIPQQKIAAATRGLNEAFGVAAYDDIRDLTERPGSNRAFRIVVRGTAYLLRINTRAGDMARHFSCMQVAADAGLAPRVQYASAEDRISITDFVEAAPFPATDALRRVPAALRAVHALPPFAVAPFNTTCTFLLNKGPTLNGFLQKFRHANLLPNHDVEELLTQYARIAAAYSSLDSDLAPSHNDLFKPDNILFDGSRLWLVDWEAAFQNDRYADLAVAANMLVDTEEEEQIYLQEYFGAPPDSYQAARFYLMKQQWLSSIWVRRASRSIKASPSSHTAIFSGDSGRAKSIWRITIRKPFTAEFIGNRLGTTCANQDSTKP